jgi:P27 family predicted phage terminase small subunit
MRGRKPKPTSLRILNGNAGKRPLNPDEPKPPAVIPKPPKMIQGEARKEWWRMGRLLYDAGLLTKIDGPALTAYCQPWATYCEAWEEIRRSGLVIKSSKNQPMINPFLKVANIAQAQWTRMLIEFGLTPSSRSRVHVEKPVEESEFQKLMNRGKPA